jgi:hypothetical protein
MCFVRLAKPLLWIERNDAYRYHQSSHDLAPSLVLILQKSLNCVQLLSNRLGPVQFEEIRQVTITSSRGQGTTMALIDSRLQQVRSMVADDCLWVVADEAVLRAIRRNTAVVRGPRGSVIRCAMRLVRWKWIQLTIVTAIGFATACRLLLLQSIESKGGNNQKLILNLESKNSISLFVGFGARAEPTLFKNYKKNVEGEVLYVSSTDVSTMTRVQKVRFRSLLAGIFHAVRKVRFALFDLPENVAGYRVEWMVSAAMRIASYAHSKSWFNGLDKTIRIREACFLSPDKAAFAAIDAGVNCHFVQHGLLSKSLILPSFDRVSVLTRYESEYIKEMLGCAELIQTASLQGAVNIDNRNSVLIASANRLTDEMKLAIPFMVAADSMDLNLHVRPYRGEDLKRFWETEVKETEIPYTVESAEGSFNTMVTKLNVIFVVSWGSTCLIDALYMGVIPICVAELNDQYIEDTVIPLLSCCLHWPRDKEIIGQVAQSNSMYKQVLDSLRENEIARVDVIAEPTMNS